MVCKNCGTALPNSAKFCTECGNPVEQKKGKTKRKTTLSANKQDKKESHLWLLWPFIIGFTILAIVLPQFPKMNNASSSTTKREPPPVSNPIDADCYDCHVTYLGYRIINDSKPHILVYYRFENNSKNGRNYNYDFCTTSKAYQDGAMLEFYFGKSQEEADTETDIKPGSSITVCEGYRLRNLFSPVEVTLQEYIPLFLTDMGTMTIPIA